jgi:tetratricopeptide (TPR) repeat protein
VPAAPPDLDLPPGLPRQVELVDTPFFPQEDYQCGPATLAEALTQSGAPRTPQELVAQVYVPQRQGTLPPEMYAATRRAGRVAFPLEARAGALAQEVAAGTPVVVLQNLLFDLFPRWHYALVVGYDLDRGEWILRSGSQQRLVVSQEKFERSWAKAGRWAFVAIAPQRLPATAREATYVAAAANLERVDANAAAVAYESALARWPQDLVARIGLGNIAYGGQRLAEAEKQYRLAALAHPDSGDAWNNLAQVLHELGREDEAREDATRAVALGGARLAQYRQTLGDIEAAMARSQDPSKASP